MRYRRIERPMSRPSTPRCSPLAAGLLALCVGGAGCRSEEKRLGGLVDACLRRESQLVGEMGECREALAGARAASTGEGAQGPTDRAPLVPMHARLRVQPGEDPELYFEARNRAHQTVRSFLFRARLYDAFDELQTCDPDRHEGAAACPAGAEALRGRIDRLIRPGDSARVQRPLPDFPRATKVIVTIFEVDLDEAPPWLGSAIGYPAPP